MDKKRETINVFEKNRREQAQKKKDQYMKSLKHEHQNEEKD
ncbi:hypothetical protein [Fictibacillus sp. NRS-1165]